MKTRTFYRQYKLETLARDGLFQLHGEHVLRITEDTASVVLASDLVRLRELEREIAPKMASAFVKEYRDDLGFAEPVDMRVRIGGIKVSGYACAEWQRDATPRGITIDFPDEADADWRGRGHWYRGVWNTKERITFSSALYSLQLDAERFLRTGEELSRSRVELLALLEAWEAEVHRLIEVLHVRFHHGDAEVEVSDAEQLNLFAA